MSPARKVTVYDPTADPKSTGVTLAPRLDTVKGKRAAILDNGKPNAGFLMLAVAERLRASYGVTEIVKREKPVAGPPSPDAISIIVVGGAGKHSSWQPTFGRQTRPVTREITRR